MVKVQKIRAADVAAHVRGAPRVRIAQIMANVDDERVGKGFKLLTADNGFKHKCSNRLNNAKDAQVF